jgi:hypothetical protein
MPNSVRCARIELESWVRWRLSISRTPVQHHHALLLRSFDGHKAHRWARDGFADRLGIRRIVLPALNIRLDVLGRHQADLVPPRDEFARPVMRAAASLDPGETRRQLFEKRQDTPPCKTPANNHLPRGINSVNLKDSLCDIQSYGCDKRHGALLSGFRR